MKIYRRSTIIKTVVAALVLLSMHGMPVLAADKTGSAVASGTKPITPGPTLDDFSYAAPLNFWSLATGTFSSSASVPPPANAICTASYSNAPGVPYGGSGYSLKLDYNVSLADSYAGYSSQLGSQSLSAYSAVSFWVKGAVGGEFFKIQMKNSSASAALYITDYLDGGVTTSWQKVTIPFHNFVNLSSVSSMSEFVIVFENAQCATNGSPTQGTVYIDNIVFESGPVPTVRLDHFGDRLGTSALGGNMGTMASSGTISYAFSNIVNEYSNYQCGLVINYNVTVSGAWVGVWSLFGGGADGWTAVPHNFSSYNYLYLRVRGSSAGNPVKIRVELQDSAGSRPIRLTGITTAWQYYRIPLVDPGDGTGFVGLNRSAIQQMNIVLEGNQIYAAGGSRTGTVYIDSVQFE